MDEWSTYDWETTLQVALSPKTLNVAQDCRGLLKWHRDMEYILGTGQVFQVLFISLCPKGSTAQCQDWENTSGCHPKALPGSQCKRLGVCAEKYGTVCSQLPCCSNTCSFAQLCMMDSFKMQNKKQKTKNAFHGLAHIPYLCFQVSVLLQCAYPVNWQYLKCLSPTDKWIPNSSALKMCFCLYCGACFKNKIMTFPEIHFTSNLIVSKWLS